MSDGLAFSHLMDECGNAQSRRDGTPKERIPGLAKKDTNSFQYKPDCAEDVLMQLEEALTYAFRVSPN